MQLKGTENLAAFNPKDVKIAAAQEREQYSSAKMTVRAKVKGKVVPTIFLKIKGRRPFVRVKEQRKGAVRRIGR